MIESQEGEISTCSSRRRTTWRDQQLLHEQLLEQNRELREAHEKSLSEMEELKRFQSSTFDKIEVLSLNTQIRLQNEINCMSDSRGFQDAKSVRSRNSHVTSWPVFFPPHPVPGGMLSRSTGMPSRSEGPPSIWDTHGKSGNVFVNPVASSSARYPQELNPWSSRTEEPLHSSTVEKSERPEQNQDLRCQSGPSPKDSFISSPQGLRSTLLRFHGARVRPER